MEEDDVSYSRSISDFASSMFHNLKTFVYNIVPYITRKRVWDLTDEPGESIEVELTPKRRRLRDITMSEHNLPSELPKVGPTKDSKDDVKFVQSIPKGHHFDFSSSLRTRSKENWRTPEKMRELSALSPKKTFRAPAHCKSPSKAKPIASESNDDVKIIGVVKKQYPTTPQVRKMDSTPLRKNNSRSSFQSPSTKATPSFSFSTAQESFNSEIGHRLSREEYSILLGSYIQTNTGVTKSSKSFTKPAVEVDLTKCDENNLEEVLSHIDLTGSQLNERSALIKNNIIDLTKHKKTVETKEKIIPVISIVDNEEAKLQPIRRKNSLEKKIKEVPCTSPTWLNDMIARYRNRFIELDADRENKQKIWADLKERNKQNFLLLNEIRSIKRKALTDFVIPIIEEPKFPELTTDMKVKVKAALKSNPAEELIVQGFGISIKRRDISTLKGLNWLNDEVINFYMNLLMERAKENPHLPKVYAFNTFFYPKLVKQGHSSLRRWTRKVDIFSHDLIVVPVHLQMHWCMAIIDLKERSIKYYDSMGHPNDTCLKALLTYLVEEYKDKKNGEYDINGWTLENVKDLPQQNNGSDCGVFACTFAEYACRRASFTFSQKEMTYFREKMVYEIVSSCLMS